jgi:3',5'-cyclic AMP phosphodiesterase CpdA
LARAQLERLGLPLFVVPGNHDSREPFREAFSNQSSMPKEGFIDWAETVEDTHIIGLDTLVEGQGAGLLRQESLNFLAAELSRAMNRAVVVILHHPPLRTGIQFMDRIGLENPADLAQILEHTNADVTVLAGHVHGVHHGRIGGYSVVTAPAVCSGFVLDRREHAPIGFFSGPTGCAVLETGPQGNWSVVPLDPVDGPFPF